MAVHPVARSGEKAGGPEAAEPVPAFPEAVTRLGEPPPFRCGKVDAAFVAKVPEARRWVNSGMAALYAESGFEALRCFHRAAMAEPDCARAWWGVALSIHGRFHEWAALRAAAAERARRCAGGEPHEAGWAAMAQAAAGSDLAEALDALRSLCRDFPDDVDARIWLAGLSREPVAAGGEPSPFQRFAEAGFADLLVRRPDHPGVLAGSVRVLLDDPSETNLALAVERGRPLARLGAAWGPLRRLAAEPMARRGDWIGALKGFAEADRLERACLKAEGLAAGDFPEHHETLQWRCLAAMMAGRAAEAGDAAAALEGLVPGDGRGRSEGGQRWLYHGRTAQGTVAWRLGQSARAVEAMKPVLAAPEMTYAGLFALHLEVQRALEAGKQAEAERQMGQYEAAMDAYLSPLAEVKQVRNRWWHESAKVAGILEAFDAARLHGRAGDRGKAVTTLTEAWNRVRAFGPGLERWLVVAPEEMAAAVWRDLGDFSAEADALIGIRSNGYAQLALAEAMLRLSRPAEARAAAERALAVWAEADPDFAPVVRARAFAGGGAAK